MNLQAHLDLACAAEDARKPKAKRKHGGYVWPISLPFAAIQLSCSVHHLRMVLLGQRSSPKLKARYDALKSQQASA